MKAGEDAEREVELIRSICNFVGNGMRLALDANQAWYPFALRFSATSSPSR